jgi:quinol-cytochrome oxidoreductase complex cytochrome b subunit
MRLWMLALVCCVVMLSCMVVMWIGAARQSFRDKGKLQGALGCTFILLVLTAAALRSHLPWDAALSSTVIVLLVGFSVALFVGMYAARLRLVQKQRPVRASYPPVPIEDQPN